MSQIPFHPFVRFIPLVAISAILWNGLGLLMFGLSLGYNEESLGAEYSTLQIEYILDTPWWAVAANFLATATGLIGSIYLYKRRIQAFYLLGVSLLSVFVVMLTAFLRNGFIIMDAPFFYLSLAITLISIGLFMFVNRLNTAGLLR